MNEMVKNTYIRKMMKIQNVWFADCQMIDTIENEAKGEDVDVLNLHGVHMDSHPEGWTEQYTFVTDLTLSEDDLLSQIRKNFKYEIRRNEKEAVSFKDYLNEDVLSEPSLLDIFEETYNQMYQDKGMSSTFNRKLMESYLREGQMIVTIGFFEDVPYVFHSYIYNSKNTRFFYSTSSFRHEKELAAVIGRMNKGLHWHDLLLFKRMGLSVYDWGGISCREATNGIDQFKAGFGGDLDCYYNKSIGISIKGKLAVKARSLK